MSITHIILGFLIKEGLKFIEQCRWISGFGQSQGVLIYLCGKLYNIYINNQIDWLYLKTDHTYNIRNFFMYKNKWWTKHAHTHELFWISFNNKQNLLRKYYDMLSFFPDVNKKKNKKNEHDLILIHV